MISLLDNKKPHRSGAFLFQTQGSLMLISWLGNGVGIHRDGGFGQQSTI